MNLETRRCAGCSPRPEGQVRTDFGCPRLQVAAARDCRASR